MLLATDFVPCRGVAINSVTDVAPCLAFLASSVRSCLVNLLFARFGVDVAPAPMMTMPATISAARPAKRPPLERDILLLSLSNGAAGAPEQKKRQPPARDPPSSAVKSA